MWADPFEDTVRDAAELVADIVEFNVIEAPEYTHAPSLDEFREMVIDVIAATFVALNRISTVKCEPDEERARITTLLEDDEFREIVWASHANLTNTLAENAGAGA